jgi:hypothetical protein
MELHKLVRTIDLVVPQLSCTTQLRRDVSCRLYTSETRNYTRSESPPHCLLPMEAMHLWFISLVTRLSLERWFRWWCHVLPKHGQQLSQRMLLVGWLLT